MWLAISTSRNEWVILANEGMIDQAWMAEAGVVGVPALPALIIGASGAFTGGAFTEFYFYNSFL